MIVKIFFLLGQFRVSLTRVLQVKELHEAEVLECLRLILEERVVELEIFCWPNVQEVSNLKLCVAILIFTYAPEVAGEQFNDGFEEVGADLPDRLRRVAACSPQFSRNMSNAIKKSAYL